MQGTTLGTGSNGHPSEAYRFQASALAVAAGGRVFMEGATVACRVLPFQDESNVFELGIAVTSSSYLR